MTPQTMKMLMVLVLITVLLNVSNYLFYRLYDPPSQRAVKVSVKVRMPQTRRFHTRSRVTHILQWSDFLLCSNGSGRKKAVKSTGSEIAGLSNSPSDTILDYHDHSASTETDNLYYYNGIRQGPVMCPMEPSGLGPLNPYQLISLDAIENLYNVLQPGGIYEELDCTPRQTVAIIIPYSGEKEQLTKFLYSIHPTLIKQQLEYQIFVVHQGNKSQNINRGKLLNAGFAEAQRLKKNGGWRCVLFHHHDLVPVDSRNLYRCHDAPAQLISTLTNNKSYEYSFGGAIAIKPQQFTKVNGFSNLYGDNDAVYEDLRISILVGWKFFCAPEKLIYGAVGILTITSIIQDVTEHPNNI